MPFVALELAEKRSGFLNYFSPTSAAAFSGIADGLLSNFLMSGEIIQFSK